MCEVFKTSRGVETWQRAAIILREMKTKTEPEQYQVDAWGNREKFAISALVISAFTIWLSGNRHFVDFVVAML